MTPVSVALEMRWRPANSSASWSAGEADGAQHEALEVEPRQRLDAEIVEIAQRKRDPEHARPAR